MAKITIATNYGVVMEQIETDDWDLNKPIAKVALFDEILEAIAKADNMDKEVHKRIAKKE